MSAGRRRRIAIALPILAGIVWLIVSQFGPSPRPTGPVTLPAAGLLEPLDGPDTVGAAGVNLPRATIGPQPTPVVLVPGWSDEGDRLWPLRDALFAAGWDSTEVRVLSFDDPVGSNRQHASELSDAIDSLLVRTGAEQVDVVAHSMGGLSTRWYLQSRGAARIRRVAFLGSPHRGTWASLVAWGVGGDEMHPESDFLAELDPSLPSGVEALTIRTELDTHILPNESSTLPDVEDVQLCCPAHAQLPAEPRVMSTVLEFLNRPPPPS